MDDFVLRALAGGLAIAAVAGPVGSLMLWRKMTFFGAAIAESAVLGVTLGLLVGINPVLGATIVCLLLAALLDSLIRQQHLSGDTVIGVVGHGALALALVLLVYLTRVRVDLIGYLFGDILSISWSEVFVTLVLAGAALAAIARFWQPLVLATIEPDMAAAEGVPIRAISLGYALLLGLIIALGLKLVGALLIVSLLAMPAAAARAFASSPRQMAIHATLIAAASVLIGLELSAWLDWPAGPAIALASASAFFASLLVRR